MQDVPEPPREVWSEETEAKEMTSKNLIPEIAKMLGVELGEAFKVKDDNEMTYRFTNAGLKLTHDSGIEIAEISADVAFAALVKGTDEIVKLPWRPKAEAALRK